MISSGLASVTPLESSPTRSDASIFSSRSSAPGGRDKSPAFTLAFSIAICTFIARWYSATGAAGWPPFNCSTKFSSIAMRPTTFAAKLSHPAELPRPIPTVDAADLNIEVPDPKIRLQNSRIDYWSKRIARGRPNGAMQPRLTAHAPKNRPAAGTRRIQTRSEPGHLLQLLWISIALHRDLRSSPCDVA